MPPYCEKHQVFHDAFECAAAVRQANSKAAAARRLAEERAAAADREELARHIASRHEGTRDWHIAYAAALAALAQREQS